MQDRFSCEYKLTYSGDLVGCSHDHLEHSEQGGQERYLCSHSNAHCSLGGYWLNFRCSSIRYRCRCQPKAASPVVPTAFSERSSFFVGAGQEFPHHLKSRFQSNIRSVFLKDTPIITNLPFGDIGMRADIGMLT